MKRRDFLTHSAAGVMAAGAFGCGAKPEKIDFKPELAPFSFKVDKPRPSGGTMPTGEIGTTGVKVSRMTFGSHMRKDIVKYDKEREKIIRDAHDLGVTTFDVYDIEQECFQYEPMGRHLAPVINDVVISISFKPYDGRTPEQEFERDLRVFGRDHIDMVRIHRAPGDPMWDLLFKYKEQGKIRAIGMQVHDLAGLEDTIDKVPLDYVLFPYNFYHNICWYGEQPDDFSTLPAKLRARGIGVVTMKPFAGDFLASPFNKAARRIMGQDGPSFTQAALRYVQNSGIEADTTFIGMYCMSHVYENVVAYYEPALSSEEETLLDRLRGIADRTADACLPDHYRWLANWTPKPYGRLA